MGKRGPQPTPTATLKHRGSWRADTRGDEPKADGKPRQPAWLPPKAKAVWQQLIPRLEGMGVLAAVDRNALARYCMLFARWRECEEFIAEHGAVRVKDGNVTEWPQVARAGSLADKLLKLEQHFGMTPSARASLSVASNQPKDDGNKSRFFEPKVVG